MSDKTRKKPRVIREEVKDRHTSHWDLDYVSRADLEELMSRPKAPPADEDNSEKKGQHAPKPRGRRSDES